MKTIKMRAVCREYKTGETLVVDLNGIELDDTSPVVIRVLHRQTPNGVTTVFQQAQALWSAIKPTNANPQGQFSFVPTKVGIFTVILVSLNAGGAGAPSKRHVTYRGVPVRVVTR